MELIYQPSWFELDQPLLIDYLGFYYLANDKRYFQNGIVSDSDIEIIGNINSIHQPSLGNIIALIPYGHIYKIIMDDYSILNIDSEETIGQIIGKENIHIDWNLKINIEIDKETGFTSKKRFQSLTRDQKILKKKELLATIKTRYNIVIEYT
jgi:hypothetical protein